MGASADGAALAGYEMKTLLARLDAEQQARLGFEPDAESSIELDQMSVLQDAVAVCAYRLIEFFTGSAQDGLSAGDVVPGWSLPDKNRQELVLLKDNLRRATLQLSPVDSSAVPLDIHGALVLARLADAAREFSFALAAHDEEAALHFDANLAELRTRLRFEG